MSGVKEVHLDPKPQRRLLIDDDGDGYTHLVSGADITNMDIAIPAWAQSADYLEFDTQQVVDIVGAANLILLPNQVSAGTRSILNGNVGAGLAANLDANTGYLVSWSTVGSVAIKRLGAKGTINMRDGQAWTTEGHGWGRYNDAGTLRMRNRHSFDCFLDAVWQQITNLRFYNGVASGVKVGSWCRVWAVFS